VGVRLPQGNSLVLAILRSPAHRLLSGSAIELRYIGRRSGRHYALPVQYARDGSLLVVAPQRPATKTWWRNFRTRQSVDVRLAGRVHHAIAEVVERDDPRWDHHLRLYTSRWQRLGGRLNGPLVEISLVAGDTSGPSHSDTATP
jgi:deazaflavin-dependent oxidoreductase (nitroreductase family)